jgi:hypothetical protein
MNMKSNIITGILLLLAVSGAFAQEAVIKELTGTVEIKIPGSTAWTTAAQGQTISTDTSVSTGFKSYALISIGNSILTVRPLTRLTLAEISASQGTETINVSLQTGRIRADVTPPAGARGTFTVQSPVATASTRGTVFEVDRFTLRVIQGYIKNKNASGISVIVDAGGHSYIDETTGRAALPEETLLTSLNPGLPIGADFFNSFEGASVGAQSKPSLEVDAAISYP